MNTVTFQIIWYQSVYCDFSCILVLRCIRKLCVLCLYFRQNSLLASERTSVFLFVICMLSNINALSNFKMCASTYNMKHPTPHLTGKNWNYYSEWKYVMIQITHESMIKCVFYNIMRAKLLLFHMENNHEKC